MAYHNPCSVGYQIICSTCPAYSISTHGDLHATYNSLTSADLPEYTSKFYSPTQHEQFTDVKYSKMEIGYDKSLKEIHEAIKGLPLEAYIPHTRIVAEGSVLPSIEVVPKEKIKEEIEKAQKEVISKPFTEKVKKLQKPKEFIEEIRVDELILRMIRKKIVFKK